MLIAILQYLMVGSFALLAAISPGPDFILVSKYALYGSRKQAMGASFGIAVGLIVHITYTLLGLAIIIHESALLYYFMKYLGGAYLIYIGIKVVFNRKSSMIRTQEMLSLAPSYVKENIKEAFLDGFICNLLNPKASLFFLSFFSQFIKPDTSTLFSLVISFEFLFITLAWFLCLSCLLTNETVYKKVEPIQKPLFSLMGFALIGFGLTVALL